MIGVLLTTALAALAAAWWAAAPGLDARRRLRAAVPPGEPSAPPDPARLDSQAGRAAPATQPASWAVAAGIVACAGCGYVLAEVPGFVVGAVLAAGSGRLADGARRRERLRRARLRADLPWAAELLAACLSAGAPVLDAADAVASAVGGPVADALRRAVALHRLGGDPAACWLGLAADPEFAAVGRALARAAESGTPAAPVISAEAALLRADRGLAAQAALARVGVLATAPLGLCFLPAFVLIGIVPVVLGLGADVLG